MKRVALVLTSLWLCLPTANAQQDDWERLEREHGRETFAPENETTTLRPVEAHPYRGWISADFAFFTRAYEGDLRLSVLSPDVGFEFRATPSFLVTGFFGAATIFEKLSDESESATRWGNPVIGGRYVRELGTWPRLFELQVGVEVAPPAATLSDDLLGLENQALVFATGVRGGRDFWRWAPDTFSVVVPARFETLVQRLHLVAAVDLGVLVPVRVEDGFERDTEVALQVLVEGGYAVVEPLTLGGGLSAAGVVTADGDQFQTALTLFARLDVGGFRLGGELWMNLDDPFGFAFDGDDFADPGIWGLIFHLAAGLR